MKKSTKGAWIVHHGQRTKADTRGGADFSAIDTASKAASLLTQISRNEESEIPLAKVKAFAIASDLNPNLELSSILDLLRKRRLIDVSETSVVALAANTTITLESTSNIFDTLNPTTEELASLEISEILSTSPQPDKFVREYVSDTHKLSKSSCADFLRRAEGIGFIDSEGQEQDKLFFNGNLFRSVDVVKTKKVLDSLNSTERAALSSIETFLKVHGQMSLEAANTMATGTLIKKLRSVGVVDVSFLENEKGSFGYVTLPSAFHKFADPFVDDAFDLAKALVAALAYGMMKSSTQRGRIWGIDFLLGKLIRGGVVGPAPAIGNDYKLLEERGVVEVFPDRTSFSMRLLKPEVGELALKVLISGDSEEVQVLDRPPPSVSMSGFVAPEESRQRLRRNRGEGLKRVSYDVLQALRTKSL